jgi:hypothetical protein
MLESVFVILIAVVMIVLGVFVFKALLKVIVAVIILFLLIFAGNKIFGDDWLFKKKNDIQEASSSFV